jgi:MFS family permease
MAQMAGNTSMKYYLPAIFEALGIERKTALMIGGVESTLKIACTIFDSWLVDKYGRRLTLVASCIIMGFSLFVSITLTPLLSTGLMQRRPAKRPTSICLSKKHQPRS